MNTKPWLAPILAAAAMLISACAQPSGTPGIGTESAAEVRAKGETSADINCEPGKEPWRSAGTPKRGGNLVFGTSPPLDLEAGGAQTYQGLLQERKCTLYDREIIPALAKSWTVSPDGLTWTLKLRENVKWQNVPPVNGRPFNAADAAWMIDWQVKEGRERVYWEHVKHSEPDPYTLVLNLTRPDPDFVYKLGSGINYMKPREIREQDGDFKKRAVGTGAFTITDFQPGVYIKKIANPDYWDMGADGKPLPYVAQYDSIGFADAAPELAAMRAGQIDHPNTFGFRPDQTAVLKQSNLKLNFYEILPPIHSSVWFDPRKAPWSDVKVRRAVLKAMDREAILVSLRGGATLSGYVPAAFTDIAWPEEKLKEKFKYDPEGAKKLLAESGYNFTGTTFNMVTTGQYAQEAEVAQNLLAKVGIVSRVEVAPDRAWGTTMEKGAYELGWGVAGGAVAEFPVYYLCDLMETGNRLNTTRFSDPEVDRLCAVQAKELDPAKRRATWDQLQDKLYELVPVVPTVSTVYYMALSCRVKNYKRVHTGRNPYGPVEAWLDDTGC